MRALAAAGLLFVFAVGAGARAEEAPAPKHRVLVELFTSQG